MKKSNIPFRSLFLVLCANVTVGFFACESYVPDDLDALSDDVQYSTTEFSPYVGRTISFNDIVATSNKSTLPLSFEILDIQNADGESVGENVLGKKYPVKIWKEAYTGEEKSIEEIEAKQQIEYRPAIEIQKNSGNLVFWNTTSLLGLQTVPYEGYTMDVAIGNTGGRKIQRGLKLSLLKPRAYEPSQYNASTGLAANAYLWPSRIENIYGSRTGNFIYDVRVYINKDVENTSPGSSLTVSVLDSLNQTIDIQMFKETKWEQLIHGFNHRFENGKVIYDVLYPMPLVAYPSKYTDATGTMAAINLRYNRIGRGGYLTQASLGFDFAIYEEGHWEIQFRFYGETPKFENE